MDPKDPTETRFSLLDIDDDKVAIRPTSGAVAPAPGRVSLADPNQARLAASQAAQRAAGFAVESIGLDGRELIGAGVQKYNESRKEVESWPDPIPGAYAFKAKIDAEDRKDKEVSLPSLKMLDDGRLTRDGNGSYPLHERALKDLAHLMEIKGGAAYLPVIPVKDRADHLNRLHFPAAYRVDVRATDKARERNPSAPVVKVPKEAQIRTRLAKPGDSNSRHIWAAVGPRYQRFDADDIAIAFAEALPRGAKLEIKYDGFVTRGQALWHSDVAGTDHRVGEAYKVGVGFKTADDGSASATFWSLLYQSVCVNLTTATLRKERARQRHIVDRATFTEVVEGAVFRCDKDIAYWRQAWDHATVENVLDRYSLTDPEDVIAGLVYSKAVWVPGTKAEDMIAKLKRAWDFSPGYTKSAFVDAVTRAAHTESWQDPWTVENLQDTAGDLLYAKVWTVPEGLELAPGQAASGA